MGESNSSQITDPGILLTSMNLTAINDKSIESAAAENLWVLVRIVNQTEKDDTCRTRQYRQYFVSSQLPAGTCNGNAHDEQCCVEEGNREKDSFTLVYPEVPNRWG